MSLGAFVLRRILVAIPTLFLIMLATFALLRGTGGDPFTLPEGFAALPPPVERELRAYYRFDEPWPVQFAQYARNDFGRRSTGAACPSTRSSSRACR